MKLVDTVKQVLDEHCGVCGEQGIEEDSDPEEKGTQGDDKEYQAKRDEILKGYGVKACGLIKDEKTKKQCFQDLDDAHVGDHEEAYGVEKRAKEPSVKDNAGKCESTMDAYVKKLSEGGYSYNPHPPEGKPTAKVPKAKKSDAKESVKKK